MPRRSPRRAAPPRREAAPPTAPTSPSTRPIAPPDPDATFSHQLPPPDRLADDDISTLADDISSLVAGRGWAWLVEYATSEWGSRASRARLYAKQADSTDLASLGAAVAAELAATEAVERLLNAPKRLLVSLRIEARRRQHARQQAKAVP